MFERIQQAIASLMFWRRGEGESEHDPYSIVLLMKQNRFFSQDELERAGERQWRKRFDGVEDPMYFVSRNKALTILKAGRHAVRLMEVSETYSDDLEASARNLPRMEQKRAWLSHRAWVSLDLWNGTMTKERITSREAYAVLSRFALELGDKECCAIYFPKEGWMLPNNGEAEAELKRLISDHDWT